jgi:hypothetical protein
LATSEVPDGNVEPRRREIESWFSRRGVPQLIQDYTTERQMDLRAAPYLLVWIVLGIVLWWGISADRGPWRNFVSAVAVLAFVAGGLAVVQLTRQKPLWWKERRLDPSEVFVVGALIGIASAIVERSALTGLADAGRALFGIGVIYLVVGLGLGAIGLWGVRQLREELTHIAGLVARTLPVLLILVLFLVFAAEIWEAAHLLGATEIAALVALLILIATVLVTTSFRAELPSIEAAPWPVIRQRLEGTPGEGLIEADPGDPAPSLRPLQRLNLGALAVIAQLVQSAFVALLVASFLIVFGLIALPGELVERWVGSPLGVIVEFRLFGETRHLSQELVRVSVLLGSVVGLYFTGLAMTDSAYRDAHFDRMLEEVRQLVAVRDAYVVALVGPE